MRDPPTILL